MSSVWRAALAYSWPWGTALGRNVVVKVLPPNLALRVSAEQFAWKVQLAAPLHHPHVVPVLTTGAAGELPFYTMPIVEGEALHARLSRGRTSLTEGLRILPYIARALEYAHRHGIVHRDDKPAILLTGNSAVVSDLGIAKTIRVARTIWHEGQPASRGRRLSLVGAAVVAPVAAIVRLTARDVPGRC